MIRTFIHSVFIILFCPIIFDCEAALTPKATVKLSPQTKTEILRVNLLYGERNHLYGLNLGLVNLEPVSEP
ncbi:LA_2272/LA_2273 family lipoprotein [Leptospira borgpetersenii]|uniref:LA_2272/LA_2273 family lipoprotein n=1 Tax=Leptospira borgpetersenii TaxID=174 RepID=UPI0009C11EA5